MGSVITNSVDSRTAAVAAWGRIQRNHVKERAPVTRETNATLRKRKVALRNKCCVLESQGGRGIFDTVRRNQDLVTHLSGNHGRQELSRNWFTEIRVTKESNGPREELPTPVTVHILVESLKGYDPQLVKFLREGFSRGFRLQYKGSRVHSVAPNLKTALERPELSNFLSCSWCPLSRPNKTRYGSPALSCPLPADLCV